MSPVAMAQLPPLLRLPLPGDPKPAPTTGNHAQDHHSHLDVRDGVFNLGLDHVLQRVHAPVGHLERHVQRHEGRLQVGQLHQQLDGAQVRLAAALDLLPALAQACRTAGEEAGGQKQFTVCLHVLRRSRVVQGVQYGAADRGAVQQLRRAYSLLG